jgi:hypothetical protein
MPHTADQARLQPLRARLRIDSFHRLGTGLHTRPKALTHLAGERDDGAADILVDVRAYPYFMGMSFPAKSVA